MNILFLGMVIWVVAASLGLGTFLSGLPGWMGMLGSELIYLLPVLVYVMAERIPLGEWIPHERPRVSTSLMTILFVILLMPLMTCLNVFTMLFSNNYVAESQAAMEELPLVLQLIFVAVIPAVSEEFMFRGIFLGGYRRQGVLFGAVISGVVFGLFHLNFNQFFYACMLGIAFAVLLEFTGSIFYCMLGHFFINAWSTVLNVVYERIVGVSAAAELESEIMTREMLVNSFCVYGVLAFFTTCLAVAVLMWIGEHSGKDLSLMRKGEEEKEFSPVFLAGVVICVGFMIFRDWFA